MKKFVIFTLIIAMAAGAVFAQTANGISVNAWGRGAFVPLGVVGAPKAAGKEVKDAAGDALPSTNFAGVGASWGWNKVRTDFRINGNAEFIGFQLQVTEQDPSFLDGQQHIWVKPFSSDILKLTAGRFEVDNLRGKINTDTGFEDFAVPQKMDECTIFTRFKTGDSGFLLSSEPMDGLFIGLKVEGALGGWIEQDHPLNGGVGSGSKLLDTYRFMQLGFGYDIADIGHLRAQWVGGWFGTVDMEAVGKDMGKGKYDKAPAVITVKKDADGNIEDIDVAYGTPARIEAAFALTAVQNLLVDLGFKFWLPIEIKDGGKKANGVDIALGAKYRMEAFQIIAHIVSNIGSYNRWDKDDKSSNGLAGVNINLIPTYDLDAFTIGASIGVTMSGNATSKDYEGKAPEADYKYSDMQFGFGAFVQKGLGSGSVKAGLAYKAAPIHNEKEADYSGANGSGIFSIPIILEYAFF